MVCTKKATQLVLKLCLLIELLLQAGAFIQSGNTIYDLEHTGADFVAELAHWQEFGSNPPPVAGICDDIDILGGEQVYVSSSGYQRLYDNLPTHQMVLYSIDVYLIDAWVHNDAFILEFDGQQFPFDGAKKDNTNVPNCGKPGQADLGQLTLKGKVAHSASTLLFKIIADYTGGSAAQNLGIRNLKLHFLDDNSDTSPLMCATNQTITWQWSTYKCDCGEGEYFDGSCQSCPSDCSQCIGPGSTQCLQCSPGYFHDGTSCVACYSGCEFCEGSAQAECLRCGPNEIMNLDGSCSSVCSAPLEERYDGVYRYCDLPSGADTCTDYFYTNGSCLSSCSSPYQQIVHSGVTFCVEPCTGSDYYYQHNDTCDPACDTSIWIASTQDSIDLCERPCTGSEYYYPHNNTCSPNCDTSSIWESSNIEGIDVCQFTCPNNQYILYDGSCSTECPDNWSVLELASDILVCQFPCGQHDFLLANGSCVSTCPSPYKILNIATDMNECIAPCDTSSEYWLVQHNSCAPKCLADDFSLVLEQKICESPCSSNQFLNPYGECMETCEKPLIANGTLCLSPCDDLTQKYRNTSHQCISNCSNTEEPVAFYFIDLCKLTENKEEFSKSSGDTQSAFTITANLAATSVAATGGGPSAFGLVVFNKFLYYIRYIDIKYPEILLHYFQNSKNGELELDLDEPQGLVDGMDYNSIPPNFSKYELHSRYFINYWSTFITLLILMGFAMSFSGIQVLMNKYKFTKHKDLIATLTLIFRWNLFLLIFLSQMDEITLYSTLELSTLSISNFLEFLSFILSISCIAIALLVMYKMLYIAIKFIKIRKQIAINETLQAKQIKDLSKKWKYYQVLFKGFKMDSFFTQGYLFIFFIRVALYNLVISVMATEPLAQAIFITIFSIFMLLYILIFRPFKSKINFCEMICFEVCVLAVNICVLTLADMDHRGEENLDKREQLGEVIIIFNLIFFGTGFVFLVMELTQAIYSYYKSYKQKSKDGKQISCAEILTIPFQSGGMEFGQTEDAEEKEVQQFVKKITQQITLKRLNTKNEEPKSQIIFDWHKNQIKFSSKTVPDISGATFKKIPIQASKDLHTQPEKNQSLSNMLDTQQGLASPTNSQRDCKLDTINSDIPDGQQQTLLKRNQTLHIEPDFVVIKSRNTAPRDSLKENNDPKPQYLGADNYYLENKLKAIPSKMEIVSEVQSEKDFAPTPKNEKSLEKKEFDLNLDEDHLAELYSRGDLKSEKHCTYQQDNVHPLFNLDFDTSINLKETSVEYPSTLQQNQYEKVPKINLEFSQKRSHQKEGSSEDVYDEAIDSKNQFTPKKNAPSIIIHDNTISQNNSTFWNTQDKGSSLFDKISQLRIPSSPKLENSFQIETKQTLQTPARLQDQQNHSIQNTLSIKPFNKLGKLSAQKSRDPMFKNTLRYNSEKSKRLTELIESIRNEDVGEISKSRGNNLSEIGKKHQGQQTDRTDFTENQTDPLGLGIMADGSSENESPTKTAGESNQSDELENIEKLSFSVNPKESPCIRKSVFNKDQSRVIRPLSGMNKVLKDESNNSLE